MSTVTSLRNHLKTLQDHHRVMDKQISDDYDLHVDDATVVSEKLQKLELKREITALEEHIKQLEEEEAND
jgi:hypothetical protein|tara:strand:+ start:10209 stop:10418 length:210 start_codon:yes stop_codon:yes gene_type:complete